MIIIRGTVEAMAETVDADRAGLTGLPDSQRLRAMARWRLLAPHLKDGVPLTRVAASSGVSERTLQRWTARYRSSGLAGLARAGRADKGRRRMPEDLRLLIEGLARGGWWNTGRPKPGDPASRAPYAGRPEGLADGRRDRPTALRGRGGGRGRSWSPVAAGSFLMLAATGLLVGGFFVGSFALQRAHHYSPLQVGLAFLPVAVAIITGAQAGGRALARVNAEPAVAGLRSALVNTFHEPGGAAGVAVLSSAAGAGLVAAHLASHDFTHAFTVGAVCGAVCGAVSVAVAAVLVPAVPRQPPGAAE